MWVSLSCTVLPHEPSLKSIFFIVPVKFSYLQVEATWETTVVRSSTDDSFPKLNSKRLPVITFQNHFAFYLFFSEHIIPTRLCKYGVASKWIQHWPINYHTASQLLPNSHAGLWPSSPCQVICICQNSLLCHAWSQPLFGALPPNRPFSPFKSDLAQIYLLHAPF